MSKFLVEYRDENYVPSNNNNLVMFSSKMDMETFIGSKPLVIRNKNWECNGAREMDLKGLVDFMKYFKQFICISCHCYNNLFLTLCFTDGDEVIRLEFKRLGTGGTI